MNKFRQRNNFSYSLYANRIEELNILLLQFSRIVNA